MLAGSEQETFERCSLDQARTIPGKIGGPFCAQNVFHFQKTIHSDYK